jgi:hypothetical protein
MAGSKQRGDHNLQSLAADPIEAATSESLIVDT